MRRPVMYLAGLLLATGASLALAGPASAAPAHPGKCNHDNGVGGYWGPNGYLGPDVTSIHADRTYYQSGNSWSLLALSGVLGNGGNAGTAGLGL